MIYQVTKRIEFCYGHRLINYVGKCAHLHGHNAVAEIEIAASVLDDRGMVVDFGDINQVVKTWINEELDHTMLLHKDDPLARVLVHNWNQPVVTLSENPTAENIAKMIYEYASKHFPVSSVKLWETPSSFAVYSNTAVLYYDKRPVEKERS